MRLSIEKDEFAHQTLVLRSFFHQFAQPPEDYYRYLRGDISRDDLFSAWPREAAEAHERAWRAELGTFEAPDDEVDARIASAIAGAPGWVLIGGPPCQAYSLVGRSRIVGGEGIERYESDPRHYLYRHYLRILHNHRPVAFIFENVKGILSAEVQGTSIFRRILEDLMRPGSALGGNDGPEYMIYPLAHPGMSFLEYDPKDFVVESEQYGIPQTRHRVFVLGVRADIPRVPRFMPGFGQQVPIEAAIGDLPRLRAGLSRDDSPERWADTLRAILGARWLADIDPKVRQALEAAVSNPDTRLDRGAEFVPGRPAPGFAREWIYDPRLGGFCNHSSRSHMPEDLHRYAFAAAYAQ